MIAALRLEVGKTQTNGAEIAPTADLVQRLDRLVIHLRGSFEVAETMGHVGKLAKGSPSAFDVEDRVLQIKSKHRACGHETALGCRPIFLVARYFSKLDLQIGFDIRALIVR